MSEKRKKSQFLTSSTFSDGKAKLKEGVRQKEKVN